MPERQREPEAEEVARRPAQPGRPAPAPPAEQLIDLQRRHGNASVARMLASARAQVARQPVDAGVPPPAGVERSPGDVTPPRPGDKDDMDRAIRDYMAGEHWTNVVGVLNGFTQAEIDDRVKGYLPEWRDAIVNAAPTLGKDAERVRAPAQIENALKGRRPDYYDLAQALHRYPDRARLAVRIGELGANALAHALRWAQAGSLQPLAGALATATAAYAPELNALAGAALGKRDLWEAAILLNALGDADLESQLAPLKPADLYDVKLAAQNQKLTRIVAVLGLEPRASAIKTEELDRTLTGAVGLKDWVGAAATLQRFNDDAERNVRLARLALPELIDLVLHLRGGKGAVATTPIGQLAERSLRPRLDPAYAAAVAGANWAYIVVLLRGYPDADVLARTRDIQAAHGVPGVRNCAMWAGMILDSDHIISRSLAFLPLETQTGAAARPASTQTMTMGPAAGPAVNVPGGAVTTYDQITEPGGTRKHFGFSYQGTDADKTGWLQFLTREAEMFDSKGKSAGFETSVETEAANQPEKRKWGTPSSPFWTIDTGGSTAPFYEASDAAGRSFAHTTSPTKTEIYDLPILNRQVTDAAFDHELDEDEFADGKVAMVVVRLKFHDYLVRGMDVLYENTMTVEFKLRSKTGTNPTRRNIAGRGAATSKLKPEHHEALVRRFPEWSFYAR